MSNRCLFLCNDFNFLYSHRSQLLELASNLGFSVTAAACGLPFGKLPLSAELKILGPGRGKYKIWNYPIEIIRVFLLLNKITPTFVHIITIRSALVCGLPFLLSGSKNAVISISGLGVLFSNFGYLKNVKRALILNLLRSFYSKKNVYYIVQNKHDLQLLQSKLKIPNGKMILIKGSGIKLNNLPKLNRRRDKFIVTMASRLLWSKGVKDFVDAAKIISDRGFDIDFQLCGCPDPGNPDSVDKKFLSGLKPIKNMKILGHVDDVLDIYSKSNIAVLPSYYGEGLPRTLIEASALGLPVITTNMPGCADAVVDGVTGFLTLPCRPDQLADAIQKIYDNPNLAKKMSVQAKIFASRSFDIVEVNRLHKKIYSCFQGK